MKVCSKCKRTLELSNFSKLKAAPDGLQYKCKSCVRSYGKKLKDKLKEVQEEFAKNNSHKKCSSCGEIKKLNEFSRCNRNKTGLATSCKFCASEYKKDYSKTENGKKSITKSMNKARSKFPLKNKARNAVSAAIQSGKIVKPKCCEKCGKNTKLDGHHKSYKPEDWLKVNWLCRKCHVNLHKEEASNA